LFLFIIFINFLSFSNLSNSQPTFPIYSLGDTFFYMIKMKYNFTTAEMNLTYFWDNFKFKINGIIKYTINNSGIVRYYNYTFNYSSDDVFTSLFKLMQGTLFGPSDLFPNYNHYQIIIYKIKNNGIPSVEFTDDQGNFLILDLRYGIPLSGYYKNSIFYYNFSLVNTNVILSSKIGQYVITLANGSEKYNLTLITPILLGSSLGNYTQKYGNTTLVSNFLQFITNNSTLVIFPSKTLARIVLNGFTSQALKIVYNNNIYYLAIDSFSSQIFLYNKSFPFYPILLKNFLLVYFPSGGNLTFYFMNYKYLVSTKNIEIIQGEGSNSLWTLWWVIIVLLLAVTLVFYFILKRRK